MKILKNWWRKINGEAEYQKYLLEHKKSEHKPLSKKEFFLQKEQKKWGKINRCC